jgi:hypothetical protein
MSYVESARVLEAWLRARPDTSELVPRLVQSLERPGSPAHRAAYAGISRRLGAAAAQRVTGPAELSDVARPHWTLADQARLFLVVGGLARTPSDARLPLVLALFEGGEIGEQESLLRTLAALPEAERFTEVGVSACRTNARSVFEAIACENAFPARYFSELAFNQLVLKAIFVELAVRRIEGLGARSTPELARMASGYASERRAAGRSVPEDVDYILSGGAGDAK